MALKNNYSEEIRKLNYQTIIFVDQKCIFDSHRDYTFEKNAIHKILENYLPEKVQNRETHMSGNIQILTKDLEVEVYQLEKIKSKIKINLSELFPAYNFNAIKFKKYSLIIEQNDILKIITINICNEKKTKKLTQAKKTLFKIGGRKLKDRDLLSSSSKTSSVGDKKSKQSRPKQVVSGKASGRVAGSKMSDKRKRSDWSNDSIRVVETNKSSRVKRSEKKETRVFSVEPSLIVLERPDSRFLSMEKIKTKVEATIFNEKFKLDEHLLEKLVKALKENSILLDKFFYKMIELNKKEFELYILVLKRHNRKKYIELLISLYEMVGLSKKDFISLIKAIKEFGFIKAQERELEKIIENIGQSNIAIVA